MQQHVPRIQGRYTIGRRGSAANPTQPRALNTQPRPQKEFLRNPSCVTVHPFHRHSRGVCSHAGIALNTAGACAGGLSIHVVCNGAASVLIAAAFIRNVPQLLRCWRLKSAEGISVTALATEVSCYAAMVAYATRKGYAFASFGCDLACWTQDTLLLLLVAHLSRMDMRKVAALGAVWAAATTCLYTPLVPMWFLAKFQVVVALVLGLGARLPQILLNHRRGHTGTLAPFTFIFNATSNVVCGAVAAVLTGDVYIMGTNAWMFSLNMAVIAQILTSPSSVPKVRRLKFSEAWDNATMRPGYA